MDLKNEKTFFVLKIDAFELGSTNSLHLEKDSWHWQSMCYEKPPRFNISLKETFFKSDYVACQSVF